MFGFIQKKENEKAVKRLRLKLLSLLKDELPDLYENEQHWITHKIYFQKDSITIQQTSQEPGYVEATKRASNKHYKITGIEIFSKTTGTYLPLPVTITNNLISYIHLSGEDFSKNYDVEKVIAKEITVQKFESENSDTALLQKIIRGIKPEDKSKIEIEDSFEIETPERNYYTILDMEDGNYIAIDKKCKVYRLLHDSYQPEKLINDSLETFLAQYNGDKKTLQHYFEA